MDKAQEFDTNTTWVEEKAVGIPNDDHPDAGLTPEERAEKVSRPIAKILSSKQTIDRLTM